jgi:protection-of-telomeres protein 1
MNIVVSMSALPVGFTAVKDCKTEGAVVSLLGVVVSLQEPRSTRGTDWVLNFSIQDDFSAGSVGGSSGMGCRVFKPQASLPKITAAGDIVILRNFKLNPWQGRMDCVSQPYASGILVFPGNKIPIPELSHAYLLGTQRLTHHATPGTREPTIQEQKAVLQLAHSSSSSAKDVQQHAIIASTNTISRRKEALIEDLTFDKFYDIKAQVVNIYYSNSGTVELKVTDYTPNKDLYLYADPDRDPDLVFKREWRGPFGQVTMDVRLYEPHAAWARQNLTNGDFVYLRNIHTKASERNMLEGAVHQDRQMPHQIDVRKLSNHPAIEEINRRREAYEQQRSSRGTVHLANAPKKSSAKASAKKRQQKRERQRLQKETELKELEEKQEKWEAERSGVNMNGRSLRPVTRILLIGSVRASFPDKPLSTLSEIINNSHLQAKTSTKYNSFTLPFVNCRHRSRVRVVDFYPPELEYFSHSAEDSSWTPRPKHRRWEWGFVLLLEDANVPHDTVPEQLRLIVNNDAAQYLGLPRARE